MDILAKWMPYHVAHPLIKGLFKDNYDDTRVKSETYSYDNVDHEYLFSESFSNRAPCLVIFNKIEVVGYALFLISTSVLNKSVKEATNVVFFINKKYRNSYTKYMFDEILRYFNDQSIKTVLFTVASPSLGKLLKKHGFKHKFETWGL